LRLPVIFTAGIKHGKFSNLLECSCPDRHFGFIPLISGIKECYIMRNERQGCPY
jgi:hypothetical protein